MSDRRRQENEAEACHGPSVRRGAVLGDPGDLNAPVGSEPWAIAVRLELQATLAQVHDVEMRLERYATILRHTAGWRALRAGDGTPFPSFDAFCREPKPYGLGLSPRRA
jgi:hypothetical protein